MTKLFTYVFKLLIAAVFKLFDKVSLSAKMYYVIFFGLLVGNKDNLKFSVGEGTLSVQR